MARIEVCGTNIIHVFSSNLCYKYQNYKSLHGFNYWEINNIKIDILKL